MNDGIFFEKTIAFLDAIGIEIIYNDIRKDADFLPGFFISAGKIVIDTNRVKFPGDLLHEAGHIAVVPSLERDTLDSNTIGNRREAAAEEMMAIAWTFAACVHLNIDPHFVFHENGYKGGGAAIVENFKKGNYFGVPVLEWLGMTTTSAGHQFSFPNMIKWMRD